MNTKRIIAIFVCICCILSLTACKKKNQEPETTQPIVTQGNSQTSKPSDNKVPNELEMTQSSAVNKLNVYKQLFLNNYKPDYYGQDIKESKIDNGKHTTVITLQNGDQVQGLGLADDSLNHTVYFVGDEVYLYLKSLGQDNYYLITDADTEENVELFENLKNDYDLLNISTIVDWEEMKDLEYVGIQNLYGINCDVVSFNREGIKSSAKDVNAEFDIEFDFNGEHYSAKCIKWIDKTVVYGDYPDELDPNTTEWEWKLEDSIITDGRQSIIVQLVDWNDNGYIEMIRNDNYRTTQKWTIYMDELTHKFVGFDVSSEDYKESMRYGNFDIVLENEYDTVSVDDIYGELMRIHKIVIK